MKSLRMSKPFWLLPLVSVLAAVPLHAQEPVPSFESPILSWTNYYRLQYGRPAVQVNPVLTQLARQHARHMAEREEMAHALDGKTVVDRAKAAQYAYVRIGENVAFNIGYPNPAWKCFLDWMYSPSHWENIQEAGFTEIGVGVYRSTSGKYYACQVLAQPVPGTGVPRPLFLAQQPYPVVAPGQPFVPFGMSPVAPNAPMPRIDLPEPRTGRDVTFSPVFQMPAQDYYVHPFPIGFGN